MDVFKDFVVLIAFVLFVVLCTSYLIPIVILSVLSIYYFDMYSLQSHHTFVQHVSFQCLTTVIVECYIMNMPTKKKVVTLQSNASSI